MRVLFVISGLALGGAERQVVLASKELVRLGHAVSIYTLTSETPRLDELSGTAVEVVVDQKASRLDWKVLWRLRKHIRSWQPDVVHGFLYDGDIYSRLAAMGTGVPVLNSERSDSYELSIVQRLGYALTSWLCSAIVANTFAGASFARRLHRIDGCHVHVVWNGIDLAEIDARLLRSSQPAMQIFPGPDVRRLCIVGSIKPIKDYMLVLSTFRRLLDIEPSWRLICVGDAPSTPPSDYKAQVLARCKELGLLPFVKFVGHRRDVPEIIGSCDVMLMTSKLEGFPNVVLEAMACGTPVATTDYSDVSRILPVNKQIVASRDCQELANAVQYCYGHSAELSAKQRHWAERHGTAASSARALIDTYASYVGRRRRGPLEA